MDVRGPQGALPHVEAYLWLELFTGPCLFRLAAIRGRDGAGLRP